MAGLDIGAMVSLDHNYAQVYPIRIKGKEPQLTVSQWPPLNCAHTPRRQRTKSYNSDRVSESGETLEEEDLIEYYSQWCDRVFSGENLQPNPAAHLPDPDSLDRNQSDSTQRTSPSADSLTQRTSPSTDSLNHRTSPSADSLNNLNLLASCGTEDQRSRGEEMDGHKREVDEMEFTRQENDYQVLAAANALLQLSGTEKVAQSESLGDAKRRKLSDSLSPTQTSLNSPRKNKTGVKGASVLKYAPTNVTKKPFVYSATRPEVLGKRKKKKRKYRKTAKGTTDDDDSIDSELHFPQITFMSPSFLAQRCDPWGQATPEPVLSRIFYHVVQAQGPIPTLCRLSSVCKLWYTAARDPMLWQEVDLSGEKIRKCNKYFHWLCKNRLAGVKRLNLTNWEALTGRELTVLSKNCSRLQSLSLSRCTKLNSSALRGLVESCGSLTEVDISHTSTVITSRYLLDYLLEMRGPQLTSLNLSCNILVKFETVMHSLLMKCSELRVLDLSNVVFSCTLLPLHIESLQAGCPQLRVLLLSNSLFKAKKSSVEENVVSSAGFPYLESLSVARSTVHKLSKYRYVSDDILYRFLKTSDKLKHLDVSGCRHVTNRGLQNLPLSNLCSLNIAHCSLVSHLEVTDTINKWSHSLESVDLGGNTVEWGFIRFILDHCPRLSHLSLAGCHGLPWDLRREYQRDMLGDLRENLAVWAEEEVH